ncbi:MAG TPA: ketopantoate reductase family protein [Anaerovoracaceae bacterium]|nr:ketopantoate reductase family protein [Anaerovoracaceae bacterium]
MKVLLVGCGAVGLSLASALYQSNADADLLVRDETAEAIRKHGVERRGILGQVAISPDKIRIYDKIEKAEGGYDFIINSAKVTGNADIAESLARRRNDILGPEGRMVLFQNGYGNEQAFTGIFHIHQIYHASFAIGFKRPELHISEATVITTPISIGSIFGCPAEPCEKLADAIDRGGIPCELTNEIGKTLWAKMLFNCTLNPLSTILGTNYGGLMKSERSISLMEGIISEIFAVMHASGQETFWADAESYKKEFFEKILPPTYGHRSSTSQDIERKIPTEIDSLNGVIVKMGKQLKINTPHNYVMTQIIKSLEDLYDV